MDFIALPTTPLRKIFFLAGVYLTVILLDLLLSIIFTQPSQVVIDKTMPRFSAARALDTTREFVTQFPKRLLGSIESRQATSYLTDKLREMGYEVEYLHYDGRIGGGRQAGRNVLAYKQGETDEIIAVTAHIDTARPTVQGAAKNGAAIGVLMELAELFSNENTRRSLLFAFTDGGVWGATGAKDLSLNYEKKDRIAAALTLDGAAPGYLAGFRLDTVGQLSGLTPPGLIKVVEDIVKEQTEFIPVKSAITKLLEKAFMISLSEQGPLLKAGIPAINLGSFSADRKREKSILHSSEDTIKNLKIETIDKYGRAAEQIVRTFAESPEIPRSPVRPRMESRAIRIICPIVIVLMAMRFFHQMATSGNLVFCWVRGHLARIFQQDAGETPAHPGVSGGCQIKTFNLTKTGRREFAAFLAAWIPFLVLFAGIRLAYAARQFPFFDLYPAVANDPVMQNPPWKVFVIIAAAVLFTAIAVWLVARYFLREWSKPDYRNSCAALYCILIVIVIQSLFYNLFLGIVFFAAPFVLWPMPQNWKLPQSDIGRRLFSIAYIAAAAVPACLATLRLAAHLGFSWNFFWYQTLALTTGLFSPIAYFMATAVIAVGIRFTVATLGTIRK